MTDSSEIGRFGTLRLLKRHHPDITIAFFPIDDEEVTFGRGRQCSIRLYYDYISDLHCTLHISEERKAFLTVHGTNGLLVDGCKVAPSKTPGTGHPTVPLTNGSEIEIHNKQFRFEYPPKEIRAALLSTPRHTKSRKSLRMSMIRTAQVYTPRAGGAGRLPPTPRRGSIKDNIDWEALRSPVRVPSAKDSTEEMALLDGTGDDATVVEEEADLIILEHVNNQIKTVGVSPSKQNATIPTRTVAFALPASTPPPPKAIPVPISARPVRAAAPHTPPHRRRSAPSLHRAVVLRSAQRVFFERERQRQSEMSEDEDEEQEVIAAVSPERDLGPFELNNDDDDEDEDGEDEAEIGQKIASISPSKNVPSSTNQNPMSILKAGFDVVKKITFDLATPEDTPLPDDQDDNDSEDDSEDDQVDDEGQTPVRRNLPQVISPTQWPQDPFTTPQGWANKPAQRIPVDVNARASVGGPSFLQRIFGSAQRVRVVPPWKLVDIEIPEPQKQTVEEKQLNSSRITEEERQLGKAINARRKSALQTSTALPMPGPLNNFTPSRRLSDDYTPGEDQDEDAETMLEKMKQKMDSVRRKSEIRRMRLSIASPQKKPDFSLLATGTPRTERPLFSPEAIAEETLSQTRRAGQKEHHSVSSDSSHDEQDGNSDVEETTDGKPDLSRTPVRLTPAYISHTPRFDGVREMFRQPRLDPRTPSFAGVKEMYQRPIMPPKTPSFRGIKEMYKDGPSSTLATPHMNLGEIFDDGEMEDEGNSSDEESDHSLSLDEEKKVQQSKPACHSRSGTTRNSKRIMSTKKSADVPSSVSADEIDVVGHIASTRRTTKRSSKKTTVSVIQEEGSEDGVQPKASRVTRRKAPTQPEAASFAIKGITVHKTTKTRRAVNIEESDEELSLESLPKGSTNVRRRARSKDPNTTEEETASCQVEELAVPKTRSGRTVKTPQPILVQETVSAPAKMTRRVKTETLPDVEVLAPDSKPTRQRRGTKTKESDHERNQGSSGDVDGPSSDVENIPPRTSRGRAPQRAAGKNTLATNIIVEEDREKSDEPSATLSGKTPAPRGRRTPTSAPVVALDAPAKRTRSRK
ncbi:hypothetical protein BU17DRAFT_70715 [Hysterangium stoloniferum]|nr:hypothetical protein BU17DRAFT_70715 [Hysterangium stoloniferum]